MKRDCLSQITTTMEASKKYSLSDSYLRRLIAQGKVRGQKTIRTWLVDVPSLLKFLKTERRPGPKPKGSR
jgi:hypothetical protein